MPRSSESRLSIPVHRNIETRLVAFLLSAALVATFGGCRAAFDTKSRGGQRLYEQRRTMFGTLVTIKAYDKDRAKAKRAVGNAFAVMAKVEKATNNFDPSSDISRFNAAAGKVPPLPTGDRGRYLEETIAFAFELARETGGTFDPTILPVTKLWGFGGRERVPPREELRQALRLVGYRKLARLPDRIPSRLPLRGMGLDLGGISKGYAVGQAISHLKKFGIRHALVTTGSTTSVYGGRAAGEPWRIGVENPRAPGKIIGVVSLKEGVVSTSGDYQNYFERGGVRYHHILDPWTGMPARTAISATYVFKPNSRFRSNPTLNATSSDVLSTALFVAGFEKAKRFVAAWPPMSIIFVTPDRRVHTAGRVKGIVSGLSRRV